MKLQFPLAPEEMKIDTTKKLVGNFCPKYHHVLHYRNLKQYFELGMILKKSSQRNLILSIKVDGTRYKKE